MPVSVCSSLTEIPAAEWNALSGGIANPFLRHEFLSALEAHGCVGEKWGWHPRHLLLRDDSGKLIGALPLYLKENSYGELVFDWSWAEAYQRSGRRYYPKLVSAVPYSPVTGPRFLGAGRELLRAAMEMAAKEELSSLHLLFLDEADAEFCRTEKLPLRYDVQFHWNNRGWGDFDDFLNDFTSKRRKQVRRERRRVIEQGITIRVVDGHTASDTDWSDFHRFYRDTFERRGGHATLTLPFFRELAETMPEALVLMLAEHEGKTVAGALSLRSSDTLYGRHWGCDERFDNLHFELCYYQGIDYCLREGLSRFEPGAQGEHKVWRGFEPTLTRSAHWIREADFAEAVAGYCEREEEAIREYAEEMRGHLPFRDQDGAISP